MAVVAPPPVRHHVRGQHAHGDLMLAAKMEPQRSTEFVATAELGMKRFGRGIERRIMVRAPGEGFLDLLVRQAGEGCAADLPAHQAGEI